MLKTMQEIIARHAAEIRNISDHIFNNPELGLCEYDASAKVAAFLRRHGFETETGVAGLPTAVKAVFCNNPQPDTPTVCIIAEYDALAGFGHGCGHNLITAATLAAAAAVKEYALLNNIPMRLCVMGTPGEEDHGGKVIMLEKGVFDGIDMALMSHPSSMILPEVGALGLKRAVISFYGKSSHAGAAPWDGINALDALHYFYADLLEWKKTISPQERVHGIFTKTGDAPNIIPDYAEAVFYIRSPETARLDVLQKLLENSVKYGAEKIGCRWEIKWRVPYLPIKANQELNKRYVEIWKKLGVDVPLHHDLESGGSTDMGNITHAMPGAHFHFSITGGAHASCHSLEFKEAAGSDTGFAGAMQTAPVLAALLLDYSTDKDFRNAVNNDFNK